MLFCDLLTFFNCPDHSFEFVQYLEFSFDNIPNDDKYINNINLLRNDIIIIIILFNNKFFNKEHACTKSNTKYLNLSYLPFNKDNNHFHLPQLFL